MNLYTLLNCNYYKLINIINKGVNIMNKNEFIKKGKKVTDFNLKDQNGEQFKLSDYKGKRILLSFHPFAWTSICGDQMQLLEKYQSTFQDLNTIAVGVSIDTTFSKKAWADSLDINKTRLLSDFWPHGLVAEIFGIFREKEGFSERANIIIDEDQKIYESKIYEISTLPDFEEIIKILKK